jgi:Ca2+-binding RTX toxin-like protein
VTLGGGGRRFVGLVAVAAALPAAAFAGDQSPQPSCGARPATIAGTSTSERIEGTRRADVIYAGAGDDVISGANGPDIVCGGDGNDWIAGGTGSDVLLAGAGTDRLLGGRGNDWIAGGPGDGDIAGGELGDDRVLGGTGDGDEAAGNLGIDAVNGGPGDGDLVSGDYGWDRMSGGSGTDDVASFASAVSRDGGKGVWVSLGRGRARGDGRDRLKHFEGIEGSAFADALSGDDADNLIDGGPGDDRLRGGGGFDTATGDSGKDRCSDFDDRHSCGAEIAPGEPLSVEVDRSPAAGGGLAVLGGVGGNHARLAFDPSSHQFSVHSTRRIGVGEGCVHLGPRNAACLLEGPARRVIADLGPGDDRLRLLGGLSWVESVRVAGGAGDDVLRGGDENDLFEAGGGSDRLYGGSGSDGLVGGASGPDRLLGGSGGDLLAAGGGCVGGFLAGGRGRDNASFAETPAHPGVLFASLARGVALIKAVRGCKPVRLAGSNEDLEGSFDFDVLVGDAGDNNILGQPGRDSLYGRGGDDVLDARDGRRDRVISCGARGTSVALRDGGDPKPSRCGVSDGARRPPTVTPPKD